MPLQPVCREQKTQAYHFKLTQLYTLCVNQLIPSYVLLQDKTVQKVELEGSNNHSTISNSLGNLQCIGKAYAMKEALYRTCILPSITLQLPAVYRLAEKRHPI